MLDTYILGIKTDIESIKELILSKIYISYRRYFQCIKGTKFDNDIGWGCTIRCGQMLFANAFLIHQLGKEFNLIKNGKLPDQYINIISMFIDNELAKFSINNLISGPIVTNILPGKWCGPVTITNALSKMYNSFYSEILINNLEIVVFNDRIIYLNRVFQSLEENNSVLLIMPMRIGLDNIENKYKKQIKNFFKFTQFAGMIGGKKNASYYFLGLSKEKLIYLDPHKVQNYNLESCITDSYSTNKYGIIDINEISTTISIAFYIKDCKDFANFTSILNKNINADDELIILENEFNSKYNSQNKNYNLQNNNQEDDWLLI